MSKHNKNHNQPSHSQPNAVRMRIDKWLWAARFYRTRTLAKEAIESGRVHYAGSRVKTSKEVAIGDELNIRQGSATAMTEKTVIVEALTLQRGNASAAQVLYTETEDSIERRAYHSEQRKLANLARPDSKPDKKQRRDLQRFKSNQD
ncbi:RNA-binding protein [Psychrobacter frigidicola]|uniref:Heat shock protein 15 n=1 Tax=Psychrobacter frigidicola TaxID=45611 RepID=A0A5C7AAW3_9GAMM|nr:S4 domain-containing protein [Psychrobacter frigidicola]TXD97993.1 RNA-binding protein [Psychrobacter frigidicola]